MRSPSTSIVSIARSRVGRLPGQPRPHGRGAEPQGGLGGLHGLVDHAQQLGVQGGQVDLVAQADREAVHGAGGVVAAAVEAPVDQVLDPAAQGLEQGGGGQGGGGHGQAAGVAGQAGGGREDEQLGDDQQGGDQGVGDGAAGQPVQVPQPVAQHRHRDGQRDRQKQGDGEGILGHQPGAPEGQEQQRRGGGDGGPGGDPAQLLALGPAGG